MRRKNAIAGLTTVALAVAAQQSAHAAAITFGTPQTISGVTDVSTAGTVLYAYNLGTTTSETVNGVTFTGWAPSAITTAATATSDGNASLATTPSPAAGGSFTGAGNGGTSGAIGAINTSSSAYFALLDSEVYSFNNSNANSFVLTLQNLSIGTQYQFEMWVNDSRNNSNEYYRTDVVSAGGNTVTLDFSNTPPNPNGVGDYVIGTFTADSTSEAITIAGGVESAGVGIVGPSPQLGAFDVEVVPEPTSAGVVLLGVAAIASRRRRHA